MAKTGHLLTGTYVYKSRQSLDEYLTSVIRAMIGHCPGHQPSTLAVKGRQNEIAPCHCITLFTGNFTALTTIANIQCVYKWNVGV